MQIRQPHAESSFSPISGWGMIALDLVLFAASVALAPLVTPWTLLGLVPALLIAPGFFIVNPNVARVLVLFGDYRGTVREEASTGRTRSRGATRSRCAPTT